MHSCLVDYGLGSCSQSIREDSAPPALPGWTMQSYVKRPRRSPCGANPNVSDSMPNVSDSMRVRAFGLVNITIT